MLYVWFAVLDIVGQVHRGDKVIHIYIDGTFKMVPRRCGAHQIFMVHILHHNSISTSSKY